MSRGYAAIGLYSPKNASNVGEVLRAAYCYDAAMVAIESDRSIKMNNKTDTPKAWRHIPTLRGSLLDLVPFGAVPVAVDLVDSAMALPQFTHPERAFYVFGPEDGTLGEDVLQWCKYKVYIPTKTCMNLAATVNVILYDRMVKKDINK